MNPSDRLTKETGELINNALNERLTKEEFARMVEFAWTIVFSDRIANELSLYHGWITTKRF